MDNDEVPLPPVPTINIPQVFALRDKLYATIGRYAGTEIEGNDPLIMAELLAKDIKQVQDLTIFESVKHLMGRRLIERDAFETAWRLAGNTRLLRLNLPVPPWARQENSEWASFQIMSMRWQVRKRAGQTWGQNGSRILLKAIAGRCCTRTIEQWWSNEKLEMIARRLGFSRPQMGMHKVDSSELVGLRLVGYVEPRLCEKGPNFHHIRCPGGFIKYNRALIAKRRRIHWQCPENFPHECYLCPIGYVNCEAATHPYSWESRDCTGCNRKAWFDPDPQYKSDICVDCQTRKDSGLAPRKGEGQ